MQKQIVDLSTRHYPTIDDQALHPVLRRVFAHRGLVSPECYCHKAHGLLHPDGLLGIEEAAEILISAIKRQNRIIIVGDYDCDGATSTSVAMRGLKMLGCVSIDYYIPNRFTQGYGLSVETVLDVYHKQKPDLILTVDNGITSIDGVKKAQELGIQVVITDHHLPGKELPGAEAIVNPQLCVESFGSKNLAGVGVVFYLLIKIRQLLRDGNEIDGAKLPNLAELLDLVALGTVADLVPLDKNNRILVAQGLQRIRAGKACPGIQALCDASQCQVQHLTSTDISFKIAPKLNAAGRLADMRVGVEALLAIDQPTAAGKVQELCGLNMERMQIQYGMVDAALKMVAQDKKGNQGICLFHKEWHQGVIGILASKIKEKVYQPTVILAADDDGETIKGSARSIPGINIREVFADIAQERPDVLVKFGGHAMAAGLTLRQSALSAFKELYHTKISSMDENKFIKKLEIDGYLLAHELTITTAEVIRDYGIWGLGFAEPVFMNEAIVCQHKWLKGQHLKLRLDVKSERQVDAMWFFAPESAQRMCRIGENISIYYTIQVQSYLGIKRMCLHVVDAVEVQPEKVS
ncbi:MAG: single-stranded-DNA-specific exonuclease RecJ [Pseudomonadota bacterium]|nr:single-stranded-DNA-specific exonuclease RecJ [Pseudomonadota bacterium]